MKIKNKMGINVETAVAEGKIVPDGTEIINIKVTDDNRVELVLNNPVNNLENGYLFLYDKKEESCMTIQKVNIINDTTISVAFSSEFVKKLELIKNFSYGRMCLALENGEQYACFYLKKKDFVEDNYVEESNYLGCIGEHSELGKLVVYLSKGGLLSAKFISYSTYRQLFYNFRITEVVHVNNVLKLYVEQPSFLGDEHIEYMVYSKTENVETDMLSVSVEHAENDNVVELTIDFANITEIDFDAYCIKVYVENEIIEPSLSNELLLSKDDFSKVHKLALANRDVKYVICSNETELVRTLEIQFAEHIYPYMFSVIMAVYNTEFFLRDALDSLITQETKKLNKYVIGYTSKNYRNRVYQNICQIILVDDGATDNSGKICDEYAQRYDHIRVIHKENGGVSSARNAGLRVAEGKYLNFMDSDDKFSENVFEECFPYFEKHYDETNIVTFPIRFFDASTGDHWLNTKFDKGNRIINLLSEHNRSQLFVNASIFKAETIKDKIWFEESLVTGEDIRFIYSNFFANGAKFGVVDGCTYWYRRRSIGEASAIQESNKTRNYYYEYLSDCLEWLMDTSHEVYGFVPHYIQYLVAQQLQWRFVGDGDAEMAKSVLNEQEFVEYKQHVCDLLKRVETNIILEQTRLYTEHRKYVLEFRNGQKAEKFFDGKDLLYYIEGNQIGAASRFVRLEFLKITGNELYMEGYYRTFESQSEFYIKVNDKNYPIELISRDRDSYALGESIYKGQAFVVRIQLDDTVRQYEIGFYEKIDGYEIHKSHVLYHKRMPLTKTYYKSYYTKGGWGIRLAQGKFEVKNLMYSDAPAIYETYEKEFVAQVLNSIPESISDAEEEDISEINPLVEALELRKEVLQARAYISQYSKKKIWLISDRVNVAGDNGEAFFRYMIEKNDPDIELYFVINEGCADFKRLSKLGNVVAQNSREHKYLLLLAEYIISSQAEEYVYNPFEQEGTEDLFKDLISIPKFVFLQHGVIKDDLSEWLNRFNKDINGFVTTAKPEYDSILEYEYHYTPKEVWLTGLPRHDRLYNDEKKYITIMPTWRSYLVKDADELAEKVVSDNFQYSDFYNFYNSLLNDERLLENAEKYGYTICFMPHPHFMNGIKLFNHDRRVKFFGREKAYHEIFAESDLIMTDYSSSIMDFVYLRKPVVYCHFDSEEFFSGKHTYDKGYFEYERDGFGEVTYDLDAVVEQMIDYMKHGCKLKHVYEKRINKFFVYKDKNNCERVYQKLLENR